MLKALNWVNKYSSKKMRRKERKKKPHKLKEKG
jgi:hypothetical protein